MNENDDIEVEYLEPEDVEEITPEPTRRKGLGLKTIMTFSAAAALLGAIGGAFGAQYFVPKPDLSAVQVQIDRAVASVKDENAKALSDLKTTVQTLRQQTIENMDAENVDAMISGIESRITALENMPVPILPEIDAQTLTALQKAQEDGFNWPDISELETQLSDMEAEIALLRSELEAAQAQPFAMNADTTKSIVQNGLLPIDPPEFPLSTLMSAVEEKMENKGFLARTFSKHVQLREPDDPIVLIEAAGKAAKAGDLSSAIKAFDQLPEDIRKLGQDWRNAAETAN